MKNIKFKEVEYSYIPVDDSLPSIYSAELMQINVVQGKCLLNSYNVSRKFNEIKMVEGFLVTQLQDGKVECFAHVWNVFNEIHFDVTIYKVDTTNKIRCSSYFIAEIYNCKDKKTEEKQTSYILSGFLDEPEKHIVFKTEVKKVEVEFRAYLKNQGFCNQ